VGLATLGLVPLAGCVSRPLRPANDDGTYCHREGKPTRRKLTCTQQPVPAAAVEDEAQRFLPDPAAVTVVLVRRSWADTPRAVPVSVDGQLRAMTVPQSWVRLRLPPGRHQLGIAWEGGTAQTTVEGLAGDVRYVELAVSSWAWATYMALEATTAGRAQRHALASRLVADVRLLP
jgi:hypothetical protein